MDRIKGGWLLLAASVLGLLVMTGALFPAKALSAYSVSAQAWEQLAADRTPTEDALLTELSFNDYALWQDWATGRYFYSLIEKDPQAYDPRVTWRAAHAGVRLAVQEAAITPEGIAASEPLHVMAYDDTQYRVYEVACTTLPLMNLEEGYDGGPDGLDGWVGEGTYVRLFDNRAGAEQRLLLDVPGVSHLRGQGSLTHPKNNYRLTLLDESLGDHLREYDAALLGLRQDGDWLLYAGFNDRERVRNVFCSELWYHSCAQNNAFGVTNGMEYRYVELFRNGQYWGLYALGYPLDALQLRLDESLVSDGAGILYKATGWNTGTSDGFKLASPCDDPQAAMEALDEYFTTLKTTDDIKTLYGMADIDNAIDIYLFYNLIQGGDNVDGRHSNTLRPNSIYNTFLCRKQKGADTQFFYTPWDMDLTWGNCYSVYLNVMLEYGDTPADNYVMALNPVSRLQELGDGQIDTLVKQRYAELRQGAWSEQTLQAMLDGLEQRIFGSGAYARDIERWPQSYQVTPQTGLSTFKKYVFARLGYMDAFVEALP